MSTLSCPSAAPPGLSPTTVVTNCGSQAAFKFLAYQNVGTFSDYCDNFSLLDAARLKEVGSKLRNDACIWYQNMLFDTWEKWKFQEYANKVLAQQTKGFLGTELKIIIDNFHSLVGIPTFKKALTPAYAGLICKANPSTLEEAYNLVRKNYTIYVEREEDEDAKATSKWNPFAVEAKKRTIFVRST
ncbi:hypothetical protein DSO57_1023445 [Entomophthora muscae]|uniref:Uncharacterized protein n=1 Tax=Entomophthora muscae TaxID=34485 RepID=A0ACC2RHG6_9FUNG|nr:hypothetical protein DSO57_1023445 [Entomophthora muscae]